MRRDRLLAALVSAAVLATLTGLASPASAAKPRNYTITATATSTCTVDATYTYKWKGAARFAYVGIYVNGHIWYRTAMIQPASRTHALAHLDDNTYNFAGAPAQAVAIGLLLRKAPTSAEYEAGPPFNDTVPGTTVYSNPVALLAC